MPRAEGRAGGRRARVTTERKRAANRANARLSTGPRSAAGKARVKQNALRHGLNVAVADDPLLTAEVTRLARAICDGALRGGARPGAELVQRSRNSNDIAIMHQPRPEEPCAARRLEGRQQARSVLVSILRDARLRRAPQDEVRGGARPAVLLCVARRVAEAQVDLMRVRRARHAMMTRALDNPRYRSPRYLRRQIAMLVAVGELLVRGIAVPDDMRKAAFGRPRGAPSMRRAPHRACRY